MSGYSKTAICNMAISHLGIGKEIANIDTEASQEAAACRRFYDVSRESTLRDAPWPFATARQTLALIEQDPNDEWGYSYGYPSGCMFFRRILSGDRTDTQDSRVPYKIERGTSGLIVMTDMEDAIAEYTADVTDTTLFPPDFVMALSLRIALMSAPRLTAGDQHGLGRRAYEMYRIEIARVNATAFNEEQLDREPDSEFIRERE
jgi:hypothetical protein